MLRHSDSHFDRRNVEALRVTRREHSEDVKIFKMSFSRMKMEPTTCDFVYSLTHKRSSQLHDWSLMFEMANCIIFRVRIYKKWLDRSVLFSSIL